MITIEHPYDGKIKLTKHEQALYDNIKQSARYGRPIMTKWYLDQLGEVIVNPPKEIPAKTTPAKRTSPS